MNFRKTISFSVFAAIWMLAILSLQSCGERTFKVKGEISGTSGDAVTVEKSDFHGNWQTLDSTRFSPNGSFSISIPSPAAPDVYRLRIGKDFIYFPVDSTETIIVKGTIPGLATNYSLDGSEQAKLMAAFDHELAAAVGTQADLSAFKRQVFEKYIRNGKGSLLSYYVLTKTVGDTPLYNPENPSDINYYAAVATAFKQFNPTDPRVRILEETALRALRERNVKQGKQRVLQADKELTHIEITLPGTDGKEKRLSSLLSNGKRTLVVFSLMNHTDAPIINKVLSRHHKGGAINIYQVSLDNDQYDWREAASNLPWTNVFDPEGDRSSTALKYNVSKLPAFFLYNAKGELVDRADNLDDLDKMMSK